MDIDFSLDCLLWRDSGRIGNVCTDFWGIISTTIMASLEDQLKTVSEQLKQGVAPQLETVRTLLRWAGSERRGVNVVWSIRYQLKKHGLATSPDFESEYIDGYIRFVQAPPEKDVEKIEYSSSVDPTYRLGRLEAANKPPVSVKPDASLQQVITIMMNRDFSQIPVMTTEREVKGVISWKSIGSRLALKRPCTSVRECMEKPEIASADESLFTAIDKVAAHDYVLVQGNDKIITGIVTASDFNDQFRRLAEPFLLVGEVENGVRRILHGKFSSKELQDAKAPGDDERTIGGVSDLTFGEEIRLIDSDKGWKRLGLELDRVEFITRLGRVKDIRNHVMHFDPDGLGPTDVIALREFARFLKTLRDLGAA